MNATLSNDVLPAEVALASRIVHEERVPVDLFCWLRSPKRGGKCAHNSGVLAIAIEEIIGPLARDADEWLSRELKHASVWYGYAIEQYVRHGCPIIAKRQVLTALLPLYRCLATGELSLSFSLSRHRLAEIFYIAAMQDLLAPTLTDLLETANGANQGPDATILAQLDTSIGQGAGITMELCTRQSKAGNIDEAYSWLGSLKIEDFEHDVASWAEAPLLWRLAGEVIDRKPNTVLPRSWADIPVPWPSVTDHWRRIEAEIDRLLTGDAPAALKKQQAISIEQPAANGNKQSSAASPQPAVDQQSSPSATTPAEAAPKQPQMEDMQLAASDLDALTDALESELTEPVAPPQNALPAEPASARSEPEAETNEPAEPSGPCYATAEVHNHNDPVLANALNRTIAVARKQQRSLSLATIIVLPDGEPHVDFFETGSDGIKRWQSRLIDNLSSHPEMAETACYVSGEGEVIATVFDLDRGLATELIRESIIETLSGGTSDASSLIKADVPVRFHVGIATTSRPGPNLSANELIAPSRRCFIAASSQGGASIKSIEVY